MKYKMSCGVCDTRIWRLVDEKMRKTDEYHEVDVKLDNGSKMTVGVCSRHTKLDGLGLRLMTERLHDGWKEELAFGLGNEEWVREVGDKLIVSGVAS